MQTLESHTCKKYPSTEGAAHSTFAVIFKNFIWLIVSLALVVVSIEALFFAGHIGEECYLQVEPITGFGHIPEKLVTWRAEGYSQTKYDLSGVRVGYPFASPGKASSNIVLLGDSVVEGLQVPSEKSFAALLEDKLKENGQLDRVVNYGTSAYGTLQGYIQYIRSARALKPHTVVLFFHQGDNNDNVFLDGVNNFFPRPYCKTDDKGNLIFDLEFYDSYMNGESGRNYHAFDFLRRNSRIFGTFSKLDQALGSNQNYQQLKLFLSKSAKRVSRWFSRLNRAREMGKELKDPSKSSNSLDGADVSRPSVCLAVRNSGRSDCLGKDNIICDNVDMQLIKRALLSPVLENAKTEAQIGLKITDDRMVLTCGIISALARECNKDKCRLLVVGFPAPADNMAFPRELNAIRRLHKLNMCKFDFVDMNSFFARLPEKEQKASYFVYGDHLKARGHEIVADCLFQNLCRHEAAPLRRLSTARTGK